MKPRLQEAPPRWPSRVYLKDRWFPVKLVSMTELREQVSNHHTEELWGGFQEDTETILILRSAKPARRWRTLAHEQMHLLIDLLDDA